ncbi:hypothetical protein ACWFNE_15415 [Cellulomonas sp. NPDC055163]
MAYTPEKPPLPETFDELRARIPGWGVDRDPRDRPAVPRERFDPGASGARWEFPERQEELAPRERSIEHAFLTPVFGTAAPLHGTSGAIRRFAYARYSEARAAHWLLLLGADRVDALENALASFVTLRPDNPVTETGVLSEVSHHPVASRREGSRADLGHQALDPVLNAVPWVVGGALALAGARSVVRALRR